MDFKQMLEVASMGLNHRLAVGSEGKEGVTETDRCFGLMTVLLTERQKLGGTGSGQVLIHMLSWFSSLPCKWWDVHSSRHKHTSA